MDKKFDKRIKKLNPEQLQELLRMRKRSYVSKNKKAYNRKNFKKGIDKYNDMWYNIVTKRKGVTYYEKRNQKRADLLLRF